MSKKALTWIIVAIVAVIAIILIVVAVNSGNNQNGGNGGSDINQSSEITDTSVEGDVVEGSSIVITSTEEGALGLRLNATNAGDTLQNHIVVATFYDASGNVIATGEGPTTLEPGESKAIILMIDGEWEGFDSIAYTVKDDDYAD